MMPTDLAAQLALRARQGEGARYDAPSAPADDLILARRGTAYFARCLNELTDDDLYRPSGRTGFSRAYLVAEISYAARHQAMALTALGGSSAAVTAGEEPVFPSPELAATLPARALRFLFHHAEVHLNVCWRDLSDSDWDREVSLPAGRTLPARSLPLLRARELWYGAMELGGGSRLKDMPPRLSED